MNERERIWTIAKGTALSFSISAKRKVGFGRKARVKNKKKDLGTIM